MRRRQFRRMNRQRPDLDTGQIRGDWSAPQWVESAEAEGSAAPPWGYRGALAGRLSAVAAGVGFQGPTTQLCGLFPFVAGSGAPRSGVPLGTHLHSGEDVCFSPFTWLADGLVMSPGVFVLAEPGCGKSATVKRLLVGMAAQGVRPLILGDVKPDYPEVVKALGGQVITLGRGANTLNPLDHGPIGAASAKLAKKGRTTAARALITEAHARRLSLVVGLCEIGRGGDAVTPAEQLVLTQALRYRRADTDRVGPSLGALVEMLRDPPETVIAHASADDARSLLHTLELMVSGPLHGVFADKTTTAIDLDAPALELDLSPVANGGNPVAVSAAMLAVWTHSLGLVDAAVALSDEGLTPRRQYVAVLDELWRALRGSAGLVDRIDALTRVNRSRSMSQIMVTHSLKDLQAVDSAEARAKASGFIERSGSVILGAVPPGEAAALAEALGLSRAEQALLTGWRSNGSWAAGAVHPGRGRFLLKTGGRAGLPVRVHLLPQEMELYNTDRLVTTEARP